MVAVTWEYRSRVMPIWLWPSISLTILGWWMRYHLKLWIGVLDESAAYLPA
jgi:hypothetical protein